MDPIIFAVQLALTAFGILGVATADPGALTDQAIRGGLSLLLSAGVGQLSPRGIMRLSTPFFLAMVAMLVAVLLFGITSEGSDSTRWLLIPGIGFTFQPSELMKVAVIAYMASFFQNHLGDWRIGRPVIVIGVAAGLVIAQPNISTGVFIALLTFGIMIAAKTRVDHLLAITFMGFVGALIVGSAIYTNFQYAANRVLGFLALWRDTSLADTLNYQSLAARRAFAQGGFFGIGGGHSVNVPEVHTDFIAAAIGQATGLIGMLTIILLFFIILFRGMTIGGAVTGPASLLAAGATLYITAQAALNLIVALGMGPVTGAALPLVSYGMNSQISIGIAFGFIHIAAKELKRQQNVHTQEVEQVQQWQSETA